MEFLQEIGPDTMVPCFSVNLKKDSNNVARCNAINKAIFNDLCHSTYKETARRIPMVVTTSTMVHHKHSRAMEVFKKKLGVMLAQLSASIASCLLPLFQSEALCKSFHVEISFSS